VQFRAIHLRAILLPLGVAVASITAVAWYGLVKIPAQQRYITDRNLRLLKTKSAQIKSKVDNFDLSIDHALEFFPRSPVALKDKHQEREQEREYAAQFQEYVSEFAPGLEILDEYESEFELAMRNRASDPPRVVIHRDEGKNSLYLGYKHAGATIVARSDIEQVLSPFLSTGTEFDALVLVTRDGRVIAQQSSSGLELVHVDALRDSNQRPAAAGGQRPDAVGVFESLRASSNIANVILGNAEYQMYIQPVQLSLTAGESKQWRLSATCPRSGRSAGSFAPITSVRRAPRSPIPICSGSGSRSSPSASRFRCSSCTCWAPASDCTAATACEWRRRRLSSRR
jgi:hypothetical protein